MSEQFQKFLLTSLYQDLKVWVPSLVSKAVTPIKKSNAPAFNSPADLLEALKKNEVQADSWVKLNCKPSTFGPFLRNHFLTPVLGMKTDLRLGPQLAAEDPIIGMIANLTTHLKPVGLYPPISTELSQLCLYPIDTPAAGFVGMFPRTNNMVQFLPAVASPLKLAHAGSASTVTGIVRFVAPEMFEAAGIAIEKWEELRQNGLLWYLDLFSEHMTISPIGDAVVTEFWGGLYASGHIEFDGELLQLRPLLEGMVESVRKDGEEVHAIQNKGGREEWHVFSRGIRAVVDSQAPLYSIHMDAELAIDYSRNRKAFDAVCASFLEAIQEAGRTSSVEISNKNDLDFSYTASSDAIKVLSSISAEAIDDPIGLAVRDWHRLRAAPD